MHKTRNPIASANIWPLLILLSVLSFQSCGSNRNLKRTQFHETGSSDHIKWEDLFVVNNNVITITNQVNLNGLTCVLPQDVELNFKGGMIENGTLVGNSNKLRFNGEAIFDNVHISGIWNVPLIETRMFKNLSSVNILKDIFALSNPNVKNRIVIGQGRYEVEVKTNSDVCLLLNSNTDLELTGEIYLAGNTYDAYSIIGIEGDNISISGNGYIIGDRYSHKGNTGEWGMGIRVFSGNHIRIDGLNIKDCWGDCIYIGGSCNKVVVSNSHLSRGRRQGISITSASNVTIKDCIIEDISGTAPEYAIDIEPNEGNVVEKVLIDGLTTTGCKGGVLVYGNAPKSKIGRVHIVNSSIECINLTPIDIYNCEEASVSKTTVDATGKKIAIAYNTVQKVFANDNTIIFNDENDRSSSKGILKEDTDRLLEIRKCETRKINRNKYLNNNQK